MTTRISLLAGIAAGAVLAGAGWSTAEAETTLTFTSFGGAYQKAQREAWLDPLEKELGVRILEDTLTGIAEVRAQVRSGAVNWDIVDLGLGDCSAGQAEGIFEPLDYQQIATQGIEKAAYDSHWIGVIYYSTVLGYSTERYKDKQPASWADFWDVESFPGARALRDYPIANLEIALMADGVPAGQVYEVLGTPEGEKRAFAKLDEIRDHIDVWWNSGAQSAQLLRDGEVDMSTIWNGRLDAIAEAGAPVAYTYNQGILALDCLAIPKGAPNRDLAQKVVARIVAPDLQANMPPLMNYGPTNAESFESGQITQEMRERSPSSPDNLKVQMISSAKFWEENRNRLQEAWDAWKTR
ncbi:ABC transporter substrate-binding protein [Marinimicrococcus flavescens]|uniref:ABC transporter substrate-binding protein n=1 Tax=Marinimicrococcus flavescens TaxID=3031815 RepID=A0AAP3XTJ1_9PROT|nr:ABC transporter substrate-binding protein [Marinimicrococcus flavescens]